MKRRNLLSAIASLLVLIVGLFAPLRRFLEARRPTLPPKRMAPTPADASWRHHEPRSVSSEDAQIYSAPAPWDPRTGFHEYLEAQVVCNLLRPARSGPVNLGDYAQYRDALRATKLDMPDEEHPTEQDALKKT
jgi:hypothetical protein